MSKIRVPSFSKPESAAWWMMAEVARRLGWSEAFAWQTPAEVFREQHRPDPRPSGIR
jgi:hypothetical protein